MAPLTMCAVERCVVLVCTSLSFALAMGAGSPSGRLFAPPSDCGSNAVTAIIVSTPSTNSSRCDLS
jgi:hypothetical protein